MRSCWRDRRRWPGPGGCARRPVAGRSPGTHRLERTDARSGTRVGILAAALVEMVSAVALRKDTSDPATAAARRDRASGLRSLAVKLDEDDALVLAEAVVRAARGIVELDLAGAAEDPVARTSTRSSGARGGISHAPCALDVIGRGPVARHAPPIPSVPPDRGPRRTRTQRRPVRSRGSRSPGADVVPLLPERRPGLRSRPGSPRRRPGLAAPIRCIPVRLAPRAQRRARRRARGSPAPPRRGRIRDRRARYRADAREAVDATEVHGVSLRSRRTPRNAVEPVDRRAESTTVRDGNPPEGGDRPRLLRPPYAGSGRR